MPHIEEIVTSLYHMVQEASSLPLSGGKCVLDREQMLDLIDELRTHLPSEIKMAKDIVDKRNDLVAAGKREAEAIRKQAEEEIKHKVNETELVQASRMKAKEILGNAEIQARQLRQAANAYCEQTLKRAEETVASSLDAVREARMRFQASASE